jgi:hypothetical protein
MSIGAITFSNAYLVAHLLHALEWRDRAPSEAIALMAEVLRSNRTALVLVCPERPDHTQALGLVMPTKEEDEGVLLMHLWGANPFISEPLKAIVLITAEDVVCPLTGEPIRPEQVAFAPEVKKALASWRLRQP